MPTSRVTARQLADLLRQRGWEAAGGEHVGRGIPDQAADIRWDDDDGVEIRLGSARIVVAWTQFRLGKPWELCVIGQRVRQQMVRVSRGGGTREVEVPVTVLRLVNPVLRVAAERRRAEERAAEIAERRLLAVIGRTTPSRESIIMMLDNEVRDQVVSALVPTPLGFDMVFANGSCVRLPLSDEAIAALQVVRFATIR